MYQYLKEYQNEMAVYIFRHNKSLTKSDVTLLEGVLWSDLGSKEDCEN